MKPEDKERSILTDWILEINKPILLCVLLLMLIGLYISLTISPASSRFSSNIFSIFNIQALYLLFGLIIFILLSFFSVERLKYISYFIFVICLLMLIATLFIGTEFKGSKRWLNFQYFTIMPIELIKPFYCVLLASILEIREEKTKVTSYALSFFVYAILASILVLQPDISQLFIVSSIYFASIFMSGFSIIILFSIVFFCIALFTAIYFFNFNVQNRINSFLYPENYDVSQTELSLQAIKEGGIIGVGPGNGILKNKIPEANSDYIFSVVAEEYGLLGCLLILFIFFLISYNGFRTVYSNKNHFLQISLFTLVIFFCLQALIHIGVNLRLLPTTGITLPFISYGGSSTIGMSVTCGIILLLSKNRHKNKTLDL